MFDVWLKITPDNRFTVFVPHAEMGQGVHTSLAMMLADELDADWNQIDVVEAPAHPEYANYALGHEHHRTKQQTYTCREAGPASHLHQAPFTCSSGLMFCQSGGTGDLARFCYDPGLCIICCIRMAVRRANRHQIAYICRRCFHPAMPASLASHDSGL